MVKMFWSMHEGKNKRNGKASFIDQCRKLRSAYIKDVEKKIVDN